MTIALLIVAYLAIGVYVARRCCEHDSEGAISILLIWPLIVVVGIVVEASDAFGWLRRTLTRAILYKVKR